MKVPVTELREGMVLANGHTVVSVVRSGGDSVVVETTDLLGASHETLEARATKYEVEAVDITPSWRAIYRVLVGVLQNPEAPASAHQQAWAELQRMAALADNYVAEHKDQQHVLQPVLGDPDVMPKEH